MRKVFVINTLVRFLLVINTTAQPARAYRHLVVRNSGTKRDHRAVTVDVDQRLTVGQVATSIQAVCMGYGFAWLPEEHICEELQSGILRPLSLLEGGTREILSNWNLRHRSLASKQALMLR
ncbi:MAG TPA: hypothetical protein VIJ25_20205, partial [Methylococcales bacterium]